MPDLFRSPQIKHINLASLSENPLVRFFEALAKWSLIIGIIFLVLAYTPSIWYAVKPNAVNVSDLLIKTIRNPNKSKIEAMQENKERENKPVYQPRFDPSLPSENIVKITSVRIETGINEASLSAFEDALRVGVWRVANFGTPEDRSLPTILAAHRYGYLKWSIPYRLKNSFYSLPKLKVGDTVEIVWNQRKYIYEVYEEGRGEEIEDYSADLILYTCENLGDSERIFKYARLLEI